VTSAILTGFLLTKATGHHDRFYYAGSPGAGSADVEGRVQSSPLNRSKRRVIKTSCASRAGRELQRRDLTARERRQALEKHAGGSPASSAIVLGQGRASSGA
jgi:hypothetical protein